MSRTEKSQYRKFAALPDGFTWEGQSYLFSQVKHLAYVHVVTTQKTNFITVGKAEASVLEISVENGPIITLSFNEAGFFHGWNSDKKVDIKNLTDVYLYLAEHTFQYRIVHYLQEVKDKGYFTIGECRLYPHDKIVFRKKEFIIANTRFLKWPGGIELRNKNFGFWDKVKRELSLTKIPQFNTKKDTDVVFHLLDKLMGIHFN